MDLKEYYFQKIKDSDYHYAFYESISDVNKVYNVFNGVQVVNDFRFDVYDPEAAITKFRELCQPGVVFGNENRSWFYLITFYLYSIGYEIKEFPRLLARPPMNPEDFTYTEIRNRIIANGGDDNGTVRYAKRRELVDGLTFELKAGHISIGDSIEQKFVEISNRSATFDNMSNEEKLAEIANLIENLLKKNGTFTTPDYSSVCYEFITDDLVKDYRKKLHCFRHSSEEAIEGRKMFSEDQKSFLIDYGLTIVKVVHSMVNISTE